MENHNSVFLWLVMLLTLLWAIWMKEQIKIPSWKPQAVSACWHPSGTVILDLELARSPNCFREILSNGEFTQNVRTVRTNTHMDFAFIVLYWAVFVLFAFTFRGKLSVWIVLLISTTATFDVLENFRILNGLNAVLIEPPVNFATPRIFSQIKWAALGLSLFGLGGLLWALRDRWSYVMSATLYAAGALITAGLLVNKLIQVAMLLFLLAMITALFRYNPFQHT